MTPEEVVRAVLLEVTSLIPHDKVQGYVFAIGLIATDYVFNVGRLVFR